jgi:hypothetical protein
MQLQPTVVPGFVGIQVVEQMWMAVSGQTATMSFMKSRNSMRRRRFL